jgi:hypothetical protein
MNKYTRQELDDLIKITGLPLTYDKTINGWQLTIKRESGEGDISHIKVTDKYFYMMLRAMNNLIKEINRNGKLIKDEPI